MLHSNFIWSILSTLLLLGGMVLIYDSFRVCSKIITLTDGESRKNWLWIKKSIIVFFILFGLSVIGTWSDFQPWIVILMSVILFGGAAFVNRILSLAKSSLVTLNQTHHLQQFLEEIFQTMGDALIVADKQGRITLVNNCLVKLIQQPKEKLIGMKAEELFVSEISDMPGVQHENGLIMPHLKELPVLVTISHTSELGEQVQIIVVQDIRNQKENERRLKKYLQKIEQNNLELEQFSYVAAHDLKAPLRAIQNLAEFIEEDLKTVPVEVMSNFKLIKGRISRMENLINGLLEYARVGKRGVDLELTNVNQLVADIIDNLGVQSKSKIEVETELPIIYTHKLLLEQVFSNLISNAYKYNSNPEPVIRISSKIEGQKLEFSVSDNGPGIPEESKEKIFRIFQTLQARDNFESTGIGLSIVKKIVEETGCKIKIDSEIGQGSTFRFTWPLSGAA